MFYNIYQGGGGLGLLRPAGIHRRHQGGPAAAQLVERGKLGGVFGASKRETPTTSRSRVAFQHYLQGARNYLHHRATGAQTKPASVQTGPWTSCGRSEFAPSSCSPLLHFPILPFSRTHHHPLTTGHGLRGPQTHGERLINRVSAHHKRAPRDSR